MTLTDRHIARRFFVSGVVQGVGYRYFAQRMAARLGLGGFARNLSDGRVEVYAIGAPSDLSELRLQLERGPQSASVSAVTESEAPLDEQFEANFSIEFDR